MADLIWIARPRAETNHGGCHPAETIAKDIPVPYSR